MTSPDDLLAEYYEATAWAIAEVKRKFDEERSCFGVNVEGGYSPELTLAIEKGKEVKRYLGLRKAGQ